MYRLCDPTGGFYPHTERLTGGSCIPAPPLLSRRETICSSAWAASSHIVGPDTAGWDKAGLGHSLTWTQLDLDTAGLNTDVAVLSSWLWEDRGLSAMKTAAQQCASWPEIRRKDKVSSGGGGAHGQVGRGDGDQVVMQCGRDQTKP
ncbi:hypothetical protein NHX12_010819 [Muraenolepis orangiensis]|uniref:Uncharacterized protein n=1 Tax=Muraenolepis orangiensis TaxID=630683 RepID=A0A9Q0DGI8_9TELE|nr:hypothetical protein NHX12_010819 [Muraenolepis orangiensis]